MSFRKAINDLINEKIRNGMSPKEAVIDTGFQKMDGTSIYYLPYGLYQDKILTIRVLD